MLRRWWIIGLVALATMAKATTYVVDDAGDTDDLACDGICDDGGGKCTLRAALTEASCAADYYIITFTPGMIGSTLTPATPYNVTSNIRILAKSTCISPWDTNLVTSITIDCTSLSAPAFEIRSPNVTIQGFEMKNSASFSPIFCNGTTFLTVTCNYLHTNKRGVEDNGSCSHAIVADNVINDNTEMGIDVCDNGVVIANNFIGVDLAGTSAVPNDQGIFCGGSQPYVEVNHNLISGNTHAGISRVSRGGFYQQNYIGVDKTGMNAIPNGGNGITIEDQTGVLIGGSSSLNRNIISGNTGYGVEIGAGAQITTIQNNYIGANASGTPNLCNKNPDINDHNTASISNNVTCTVFTPTPTPTPFPIGCCSCDGTQDPGPGFVTCIDAVAASFPVNGQSDCDVLLGFGLQSGCSTPVGVGTPCAGTPTPCIYHANDCSPETFFGLCANNTPTPLPTSTPKKFNLILNDPLKNPVDLSWAQELVRRLRSYRFYGP